MYKEESLNKYGHRVNASTCLFYLLNKCFFIDQEPGLCPAINRTGEEGEGLPSLKREVRPIFLELSLTWGFAEGSVH